MKHEVIVTIDGKEILNIPKDTEVCEYRSTTRIFDWQEIPSLYSSSDALYYLRMQELYATEMLKARKHLFLNEVFDLLGLARTKEGAVIGWTYEQGKVVDFGIYDFDNTEAINGYESEFMLRFNIDGCILDLLS